MLKMYENLKYLTFIYKLIASLRKQGEGRISNWKSVMPWQLFTLGKIQ
jgi:hypothetical protein